MLCVPEPSLQALRQHVRTCVLFLVPSPSKETITMSSFKWPDPKSTFLARHCRPWTFTKSRTALSAAMDSLNLRHHAVKHNQQRHVCLACSLFVVVDYRAPSSLFGSRVSDGLRRTGSGSSIGRGQCIPRRGQASGTCPPVSCSLHPRLASPLTRVCCAHPFQGPSRAHGGSHLGGWRG